MQLCFILWEMHLHRTYLSFLSHRGWEEWETRPSVISQVSKEILPALLGMSLLDLCRPSCRVYSSQGKFGRMQDLVKAKGQKFLGMSEEQVGLAQQMSICIND